MAIALALTTLAALLLLIDRLRRTRTHRAIVETLETSSCASGDPFVRSLAASLDRALGASAFGFARDRSAIVDLSNALAQRASSEAALQVSEAKTRAILQALPDLMFVQDRNGTYLEYYAAAELYAPPDLFLGKTFREVLPADTAAAVAPAFQRVAETGQAESVEYELQMSDGPRSYEARLVQLPPDKVISIVRDLTDAKRAASALEQSRYFTQRLAETIPAVIFLYDLVQRRNVYVNERSEAVLGYTAQEVIDMGDQFLARTMHPDDMTALSRLDQVYARVKDGEIFEHLFRFRHKNGQWRWISRSATVFARSADGRPTQILGSATDVTALKSAEEELRLLSARLRNTQDEERRRIARELHDGVAQYLFGISAFLSTLRASGTLPHATAETVAELARHCDDGLKQVRLLSYVLHPPMLDDVGLASALKWFADGVERRSQIDIELEAEDTMERLPLAVERDLFNIVQEGLSNVIRHSGSRKAVIRLVRQPDQAMLQIQDFGRGMDTRDMRQAAGLGLLGMRERLRYVNGRLEIESGPQGTTLTAIVPIGVEAMSS
jgi:PAS domain S-box-containing protein